MLYRIVAKNCIYPIFQACMRSGNTLEYLRELEKSQWYPPNEIKTLQWKKLKALLNYSYSNVPYYKTLFKGLGMIPDDIKGVSDFSKFPILDKNTIKYNINNLTSLTYSKGYLIPNSTGGSTGVTLNFFNDKKNSGYVRALILRNEMWAGLNVGDKRAILWGSPIEISSKDQLLVKTYNKIFRILFLPSYDLSDLQMSRYVNELSRHKPKVLVGYASALYKFAQFLERSNTNCINPNSIISSAEILYDHHRKIIEKVFNCEVFDRYGCREVGTIAHECSEHLGMHINSEHVFIETVGSDGGPVSSGESGELVITDLDNFGMPFIRYKIGDIGVLSDDVCNCGRGLPILEKIKGRSFDVVVGANGRVYDGHFFPIVLRIVNGITQFQVIQNKIGNLDIKIVINSEFKHEYINIISRKIKDLCGEEFVINFEIVDNIEIEKSGKYRFVVSNIQCS